MHKLYDNVTVERALDPDIYTDDATGGKVVDSKGHRDGMLVVVAGDITDDTGDTYTLKVMECDTSTGTFTDTGISVALEDDGNENATYQARISELNVTRERFLRVDLVCSATTTSFEGGAVILLDESYSGPANDD